MSSSDSKLDLDSLSLLPRAQDLVSAKRHCSRRLALGEPAAHGHGQGRVPPRTAGRVHSARGCYLRQYVQEPGTSVCAFRLNRRCHRRINYWAP